MADGKVVIDSELNEKGVKNGIESIKKRLRGLNSSLLSAAGGAMRLGSAVTGISAGIPAIASLTVAVGGLASATAAAGVGMIGYGAVAVGVLSDVFQANTKLKDAQDALANATNAKQRTQALNDIKAATQGLSAAQKEAVVSLSQFQAYWQKFTKGFETPVVDAFTISLDVLKSVLDLSKPAVQGTATAVTGLMTSLKTNIKNDSVTAFFDYIGKTAGPAITAFGQAFGYAIQGVMNLMVAFGPLSMTMTNGFLSMMKSFSEWTATLQSSDAFQAFIDYAMINGPILLGVLKNLFLILGSLAQAFAPLGQAALLVLNDITALFQALMSNNPITPFVEELMASTTNLINVGLTLVMNLVQGLVQAFPQIMQVSLQIIMTLIQGLIQMLPQLLLMAVQLIVTIIQGLTQALPQLIGYVPIIIQTILNALINNLPQLITMGVQMLLSVLNGLAKTIPQLIPMIFSAIATIQRSIMSNLPLLITMGVKILMSLIKGLINSLPKLMQMTMQMINYMVNTIIDMLPMILNMGMKLLLTLINGLAKQLPSLIRMATTLIVKLINTLVDNLPMIIDTGIKVLLALIDGILNALPELISAALDLIFAIVNALIDNLPEIISAGVRLLIALVVGLAKALPKLWSIIKNDIIGGILSRLGGINLWDIGKKIIQGLARGLSSVHIPMPHFHSSGSLDLNPVGGIHFPSIGVDWRKDGGVFAANSPRLIGIGDASVPEAALPLSPKVLGMIGQKIANTMPKGNDNPQEGAKQPAIINLILGRNEFSTFVEDVTEVQERIEFRKRR